jgi:hypothetical protein
MQAQIILSSGIVYERLAVVDIVVNVLASRQAQAEKKKEA